MLKIKFEYKIKIGLFGSSFFYQKIKDIAGDREAGLTTIGAIFSFQNQAHQSRRLK